jgi:glycosyltransferase involved in cell wall biosynthesis
MTLPESPRPPDTVRPPLVTIVMPAYNAAAWIGQAIESILGQTLPDWELIVVNDGSTDGTERVVARCRDPRIRLLMQENRGCYAARNVGLRVARGRYVALLDADDWYEPRHLELATGFLERHPTCSLVGTNYFFINHHGEKRLGCRPGEIRGCAGDGVIPDYFKAGLRNRCFPITNCAVFRREKIRELGEFDASLLAGGDHEFFFRWAMRSQFGYVDEPTCYYREDSPGSVRKDLGRSIQMRVKLWRKLVATESPGLTCWESYAKCRSFYLFRLTALAIAAGYFDEAREVGALWPRSPAHRHWWFGKALLSLPMFCQKAIHSVLGRTDLVKFRQGRPAPLSTDA